jgi:hypothetical protein
MCVRISDHLKPDGRFVTLNENPEQPAEQYAGYTQYGFNKAAKLPLRDGSPITYWMISGRKVINFTTHFFSTETYQRAFTAAGLRSVQWHPLKLSDEGRREHGHEYWEEYMNNPPVVAIECRP